MGISIYDTQGELKQLGDVLEEMGTKWQTMSKEEQVALAQTVGGKRQYSMLMALMDNWDMYSETVKEAANAYGTLDEQQNIWAESWEAHAQQVQVSAERLYDTLLKSDSVLTAMNDFSWFLERIADATDAAGGLGNILLWIGTIMASRLTPQIMNSINSIVSGYDIISGKAHKREVELQNELTAQLQQIQASQAYTGQQKLEAGFLAENAQQKQKILKIEQNLSDQQKEKLNSLISVKNGWQEIALQEQEAIDKSKEYLKDFNFTKATGKYKINKDASIGFLNQGKQYGNGKTLTKTNLARVATEGIQSVYGGGVSYADLAAEIGIAKKEVEKLRSVTNKKEYFAGLLQKIGIIKPEMQDLSSEAKKMVASFEDKNVNFSKISQALNQLQAENGETVLSTEQINAKFAECGIEVDKLPPKIQEYIQGLNGAQFSEEKFQKAVTKANRKLIEEIISLTDNTEEGIKLKKILEDLATGKRNLTKATQEEIEAQKRLNAEIKKAAQQKAAVQSLTAITSTAMTAFMTINQVESAINNFNNGQLTEGWTNIIFSLMNIGSLIPTIKAVKVALVEAGLTAGAAWGWIAVVGVAIAGLVAIVKYFENNSLHAYTEELKETQDNISNIKSEITQIDEKTKALEEKGTNITDQEYETLQILRQQKLEKQALLNLEQDKEKESIGNTISKATKGSGFFEGQFKNILKPIEVYSGDASAYHQFFSMEELEKVRSQSNSIFEWAKRAKTDIEQSKQKVSKDNVSLPAKYDKEGNLIESARSTETILQDLEQQEKQIEKIEKNAEKNRKLWRARIKENYDEISKLNYIEGNNLTSTEKEFNKLKESTTIDYFISLSEEATNANDKVTQLQRGVEYFLYRNLSKDDQIKLMDTDDLEKSKIYFDLIKQLKEDYPELVDEYEQKIKKDHENWQNLKEEADQLGINVESYADLQKALNGISEATGIPKEVIQSLYESGAMADFAASSFGSLKGVLNQLDSVSIDATGLVTGLPALTSQAIGALATLTSLANIEIRFETDETNLRALTTTTGKSAGLDYGAYLLGQEGMSSGTAQAYQKISNNSLKLKTKFYKDGKLLKDVSSVGDLLRKELDKIWGSSSGNVGSQSGTPNGGGSSGEEKDDDKADKIWWDDYEARKKQIEEDFAAGKIDQDKYLSELDAAYQDLISHYNNACEEHKDKILEELDDLKDKNASRNIELYKSISEAVQTYGYASFNYKGQQRTISSMEEADKFWTDELAGQTIKDPRTTNPVSIYSRENLLDVNKTQWDNAKYISDEAWDQLQEDFEKGRVDFQEYWDKKTSLLYGGAWDKESNSI